MQMPRLADSLAGRMEVLQLEVFSASELAQTPGTFLDLWLNGGLEPEVRGGPLPDPATLATALITGGYPEASRRTPARAARWLRQYAAALIERDIHDIAQVADADQVARLLTLLAHRNGSLLNLSSLAKELGHTRQSVDRWLGLLERLFLIRRLPAWHGNPGKRLIKSPKVYLRDSGLAAALAQVCGDDWLRERPTFGLLLEAFVLQQIVSQAGWTRPDIGLWHYRDKDQVEVDCVISAGRRVWGAEIKLKQSVSRADTKGLTRLAALCGDDFAGGVVFYDGTDVLPLGQPRLLAVPLAFLWDR
jgi:predicted AAA+ superfamily ATPase